MNTKLISIFAVAGIVSAGSTAFAINSQILPQKTETSQNSTENQIDLVTAQTDAGATTVKEFTPDNSVQDTPNDIVALSDVSTADTLSVPTVQNDQPATNQPVPEPSASVVPTPTLPTVPPSFKPGKDDEDDDSEYEDGSDSEHHGDDSNEDSQDDESHLEEDD